MAEDPDAENGAPETKKVRLEADTQMQVTKDDITIPGDDDVGTSTTSGNQQMATDSSRGKTILADPSFKEMPHTFLQPDDPALLACV